jgi:hypothetical protein
MANETTQTLAPEQGTLYYVAPLPLSKDQEEQEWLKKFWDAIKKFFSELYAKFQAARAHFWQFFDDIHGQFQTLRALMVLSKLSHGNTENPEYAHPIADWFDENFFPDFNPNLDETGEVSGRAFNILSLVYGVFLAVIVAKILKNIITKKRNEKGQLDIFADLPENIHYSIIEAATWTIANSAIVALSVLPELNASTAELYIFGIFSIAIMIDVGNTIHKLNKLIKEIKEQLKPEHGLKDKDPKQYAELKTELLKLQCLRVIMVGFGLLAVAGGACIVSSNALTLLGSTIEAVAHLAFAGTYLLTGAAALYAVFRLGSELFAYGKEYLQNASQIKNLNLQIKNAPKVTEEDKKALSKLTENRDTLVIRQKELRYETFKSVLYYSAVLTVLAVSLLAGPVAGLIAFAVFFTVHQVCKRFVDHRVKDYLGIKYPEKPGKWAAPTPEPAAIPVHGLQAGFPQSPSNSGQQQPPAYLPQ